MRGFLLTAFPILTALASLGFAFYEKYEKGLAQQSLAKKEVQLVVTEIQNEVAQEAIVSLSQMVPSPRRLMSATPPIQGDQSNAALSRKQKVEQINKTVLDAKSHAIKDKQDLNKAELRELFKRKAELQSGRQIFPIAPGT